MERGDIRNLAIIAHVDHGKTTLLDGLLTQTGSIETRKVSGERLMDSNALEKERGITILAKTTSVLYKGNRINIVDTPGHADFGGEVERILNMVDSALLLVDAFDGPMPQTRFVLSKALEMGLNLIVVINKIDRPDARPQEVLNGVYDLFIELGADEHQLEFPVLYASAKEGYAMDNPEDKSDNLSPMLDCILTHVQPPEVDINGGFQFLITAISYDPYVGRLLIGRVTRGQVKVGEQVVHLPHGEGSFNGKISKIFSFRGLDKESVEKVLAGDIVALAGFSDATVGETLADPSKPERLPGIQVSQPTVTMNFKVNDSPLAGTEGKFVTSRHLRDRLYKEALVDVALRVEDTDSPDELEVSGRGHLHLSILIENMRREGHEFAVSRPKVILREIDGQSQEPIEELILDLPEDSMGGVMENLGTRKSDMISMDQQGSGRMRLVYSIPTRMLMGLRSEVLSLTRGEGVMTHAFLEYQPYKGSSRKRTRGVLISMDLGEAVAFALWQLQERGSFIIPPHTKVYEGMIIGLNNRESDLIVNIQKKKQLTNVRASGRDDNIQLTPHMKVSLEESLEMIEDDELVEVTPEAIRLRKRILNETERKTWEKKHKAG